MAPAQSPTRADAGPSPAVIPQPHLAFVNANLVDVRSGAVTANATVVVRSHVSVGAGASPAGAEVVDLKGRWTCRA
ncbi:MAG: hypothetical protein R2708_05125 [Vicinamibacterales bacterium]